MHASNLPGTPQSLIRTRPALWASRRGRSGGKVVAAVFTKPCAGATASERIQFPRCCCRHRQGRQDGPERHLKHKNVARILPQEVPSECFELAGERPAARNILRQSRGHPPKVDDASAETRTVPLLSQPTQAEPRTADPRCEAHGGKHNPRPLHRLPDLGMRFHAASLLGTRPSLTRRPQRD